METLSPGGRGEGEGEYESEISHLKLAPMGVREALFAKGPPRPSFATLYLPKALLLLQHFRPGRHGPFSLKELLYSRFAFCPERFRIRFHNHHAFALEILQ